MGILVKVGDVFAIPIDDDRSGIGQLVAEKGAVLYIVVYDAALSNGAAETGAWTEVTETAPLLLAALSLDGKIYNGHWPIVGNRTDNLGALPDPVFKVGQSGEMLLENRDLSVRRVATEVELEVLRYRTVTAPVRFEKALKAHHGIGEWSEHYDPLLADYAIASSRLI